MNLFSRLSMFLSPPTSFVDIPLQLVLLFHFFQLFCRGFNTEIAMKRAMKHVEENYAVVGILEEMNKTLTVLEHYVPRFFKGALNTYWGKYLSIHLHTYGRSTVDQLEENFIKFVFSKGQLISKCLIGSIVSTKKPTKFF